MENERSLCKKKCSAFQWTASKRGSTVAGSASSLGVYAVLFYVLDDVVFQGNLVT